MVAKMDCRLCLEKKKHLVEINNEIRDTFYLITQMKLHRLEYVSNSICLICYKKLLAAQGYRDMLVKIEEAQMRRELENRRDEATSEDDMSLLEEIASFNPDGSNFLNKDHDDQFSLLSDSEIKNHDDDDIIFKEEPIDRPIVEIDKSSKSHTSFPNELPAKLFKCDVSGCSSRSTTLKALKKHKRRVHEIRVKQPSSLVESSSKKQLIKKLKCKYCNLVLRDRKILCRHIETVHKQAKFYCTIAGCKHVTTRRYNCREHLKNYHRNLPEDELNQALQLTKNMQPIYVNKDFEMYEYEDEQIFK